MNKLFFAESKLIFKKISSLEKVDDVDQAVDGMKEGTYRDTREAQKVMMEQSKLKSRLADSDIFTDADKKEWENKLKEAKINAISAEEMSELRKEFEKQQGAIKGMVENYTRKVMDNRESAFTIDSSRNLDTAKEYVEWFAQQSFEEKQKALNAIDADINERIALRKKLLQRFEKKDVVKLRRSEMKDKVKELEKMEENEANYSQMLKQNERLFHNPESYLKEFKDLTLGEQEDWINRFNNEIVKPRKQLVDVYDRLPEGYKDDSKFFKVGKKEKIAFLEKVRAEIEQKYIKKVNDVGNDVMSQNSKRFAIVDFLRLKDLPLKAMWLEQLSKSIEAERKLVKEYEENKKELFIEPYLENNKMEIEGYSKTDWEQLTFEEKKALLKNMKAEIKLLKPFLRNIKEAANDSTISKKTADRYLKLYSQNNLNGRSQLCRGMLTAMKIRRDLVTDFKNLDEETQKKYKSFYEKGHKGRVQIFEEARLFELKNKKEEEKALKKEEEEEKEAEKVPMSLETDEIEKIIDEMHNEADKFEEIGEYERSIDKHKDVLKLHPENEYSARKIKELNDQLNDIEEITDNEIEEAIERESKMGRINEELSQIALAEMLYQDRLDVVNYSHGSDNLGQQTEHLTDSAFQKDVHRKIYESSNGKQMLDDNGQIIDIETVDLNTLGQRDRGDIRYYRERLRNLKNDDNLENIQFVDGNTGRRLRIDEARSQLDKRKTNAAKEIAKSVKGLSKTDAQAVFLSAMQLIESQVDDQT